MDNLSLLYKQYDDIKSKKLSLDMTRGKPSPSQLNTVEQLLTSVSVNKDCISENGIDCRNYGGVEGIPEARRLFAEILELDPSEIIIGGNSSLSLMYDVVTRAMLLGVGGNNKPWCKYDKITFLCPSPGYDRHFKICELFGINMIMIPMLPTGPDMDMIEALVANDDTIKGMWSIPKYSNPTGVTFSNETVKRLASMNTKADDFRVFWDNAYVVHDLTDTPDVLLNVLREAEKYGNQDRFFIFASTSKITYSGAGIAAFAGSKDNVNWFLKALKIQTIGYDKLNQLRHIKMLPNLDAVKKQMEIHKSQLYPKFKLVLKTFENELSDIDSISWTNPNGGYFISLTLPDFTAKRVVALAKEAGLVLTPAGAGFPYDNNDRDNNIRIAPSYPSIDDLRLALPLLCLCIKIAVYEKQKNA